MAHYDEQEEAFIESEKKYRKKEDDMVLDFEVPDKEIEYQEDDGNSSCDGGGCTI